MKDISMAFAELGIFHTAIPTDCTLLDTLKYPPRLAFEQCARANNRTPCKKYLAARNSVELRG
ncbi:MAG: hypothetical protein ACYTEW_18860 [Planctomycetota bacterium]